MIGELNNKCCLIKGIKFYFMIRVFFVFELRLKVFYGILIFVLNVENGYGDEEVVKVLGCEFLVLGCFTRKCLF